MSKKKSEQIEPENFHLSLVGADAHAHLTSLNLLNFLPVVLEKAKNSGVASIGNVFLGPDEYYQYRDKFLVYPQVFFILGIHPCDALHYTDENLSAIKTIILSDDRVKAIGEIGLDFYWKNCPFSVQEKLFRKQLILAKELNYPIVIHSREAAVQTVQILEEEGCVGYPILWHCFSGDVVSLLDRVLANGWFISIAGPVTYHANRDLQNAVVQIPLTSLLLETDCPYLTPTPWRGKENQPAFVVFIAKVIAELKGISIGEVWKQCGDNTRSFFRILPV